MGPHGSFTRKIIYLVAIALLLMPLFWLSQPATSAVKGAKGSPGGKLAQLRDEHHLSQAQLGQIDPTSVTIKLATLGLRGVAANILWEKANDYKMKKDWTNLAATLNQITKVQPNFISVWSNQGWNLAYNVSASFDDYRERYRWVIKGIDFLKEGAKYNEREPRLLWDLGWTISQKIGRSDEAKQFRRLFKEDDDFHRSRPLALRDNWLVGKEKFAEAERMVDTLGVSMMGKSPLIFRSDAPMCQMSYAEAIEKDGTFGQDAKVIEKDGSSGQNAKQAWANATDEWRRYGAKDIPTSFRTPDDKPVIVRLNEEEMELETAKKLVAQLDAMQPGLREKIIAEKRAALSEKQREALDTPPAKRAGKQFDLAAQAEEAVKVTHDEVAKKIAKPKRAEALKLAKDAAEHEQTAVYIRRYREVVNFVYWRLRALVEQSEDAIEARRLIYQGDRAYSDVDIQAALDSYQQGLQAWRKVFDAHPDLIADQTIGEDLMDVIKRYRRVLGEDSKTLPEKFILQDIIDQHEQREGKPPESKQEKGESAKPEK